MEAYKESRLHFYTFLSATAAGVAESTMDKSFQKAIFLGSWHREYQEEIVLLWSPKEKKYSCTWGRGGVG